MKRPPKPKTPAKSQPDDIIVGTFAPRAFQLGVTMLHQAMQRVKRDAKSGESIDAALDILDVLSHALRDLVAHNAQLIKVKHQETRPGHAIIGRCAHCDQYIDTAGNGHDPDCTGHIPHDGPPAA